MMKKKNNKKKWGWERKPTVAKEKFGQALLRNRGSFKQMEITVHQTRPNNNSQYPIHNRNMETTVVRPKLQAKASINAIVASLNQIFWLPGSPKTNGC